jgi:hypothetical protein
MGGLVRGPDGHWTLEDKPVADDDLLEVQLPGGRWAPAIVQGMPNYPTVVISLGSDWRNVTPAQLPAKWAVLRWPQAQKKRSSAEVAAVKTAKERLVDAASADKGAAEQNVQLLLYLPASLVAKIDRHAKQMSPPGRAVASRALATRDLLERGVKQTKEDAPRTPRLRKVDEPVDDEEPTITDRRGR